MTSGLIHPSAEALKRIRQMPLFNCDFVSSKLSKIICYRVDLALSGLTHSLTRPTPFLSGAAYKADITSQVLLGLAFASLVTRILGAWLVVSTRLANFLDLNPTQLFARAT